MFEISRRSFLATLAVPAFSLDTAGGPLQEFPYASVRVTSKLHAAQLEQSHATLMDLSEDSILRPFRLRQGLPAPGAELGGWYSTYAFAPTCTFGQWVSALCRYYAITGDPASRAKAQRLMQGYAATIEPSGKFYVENRFPSYLYDKLVLACNDLYSLANDPAALEMLRRTTEAASTHLPAHAVVRRETPVLHNEDMTEHCWDESYTLPENLFLAQERSGGSQYRALAKRFLMDEEFFDPLARGENVLPGKHAYSHVNALSSAAKAYLVLGDEKHLRAVKNGFAMVQQQSYATGGWGPDEHFFPPDSGKLGETLTTTHASFETPCGAYAHFKIARYLLRITKDSRYGDSMERVMWNTVLGAKPLEADGHAFYYADYNVDGKKAFHQDRWPCCSGTLPQIAADYGISSYFRDAQGLFVNLYVPSTVQWSQNGARLELSQAGDYPFDGQIRFALKSSRPCEFKLRLRIPDWTGGAGVLSVNGKRTNVSAEPGRFAELTRTWQSGDRVDLELPLPMRLEAVDRQHPQLLALLRGPLVLFAIEGATTPVTRQQLLAAERVGSASREWTVKAKDGTLRFRPFTEIGSEGYRTYLKVTA